MNPGPQRRAAIVTGGLSGIGHAVAMELARSGHNIAVGARDLEGVVEAALGRGGVPTT